VVCEPLVPVTANAKGFAIEAVRLLTVTVLVWPAKMVAGLKEHVKVEGQLSVMFPVKLLGADAETVTVAVVFPMRTSTLGLGDDIEKTAAPEPERATVWGLPAALSLIVKEPFRAPETVGEKVTLTLQLWPTLRTFSRALQVFVCEKSPVVLMPVMFSVDVPVLVMVTD
jgi:hypothetical protein